MNIFKNKRILVTGGTGSLGRKVVERLLQIKNGGPSKVLVFSRDEGKHHQMLCDFKNKSMESDSIHYLKYQGILDFQVGDVRDLNAVKNAVKNIDIVIHAAALKQVPSCEYFPEEAFKTNVLGATNLVNAVQHYGEDVCKLVAISTDKACKPINTMGMTKSISEKIITAANLRNSKCSFFCVRYGNVVASRGSVVPLFVDQIKNLKKITITDARMTRFLITLDQAVDTVFAALEQCERGEILVPKLPAVNIVDLAKVLIGDNTCELEFTAIRPGEKIHEIMISEEESRHVIESQKYFRIIPNLPELINDRDGITSTTEYSSSNSVQNISVVKSLLQKAGF